MARVVFLHPDLGIGGAERLVVDAAVALKSKGCSVQIWTAHYDPTHCFSETLDPDLPVVRWESYVHCRNCENVCFHWFAYSFHRSVWVTGSPPVCLATYMLCAHTWGWSTWPCTSSFSVGWSMMSSSVIRWFYPPSTIINVTHQSYCLNF